MEQNINYQPSATKVRCEWTEPCPLMESKGWTREISNPLPFMATGLLSTVGVLQNATHAKLLWLLYDLQPHYYFLGITVISKVKSDYVSNTSKVDGMLRERGSKPVLQGQYFLRNDCGCSYRIYSGAPYGRKFSFCLSAWLEFLFCRALRFIICQQLNFPLQ